MGEFFGHLTDTKWLEWKGWFCACCCPGYVWGKVAYDVSTPQHSYYLGKVNTVYLISQQFSKEGGTNNQIQTSICSFRD